MGTDNYSVSRARFSSAVDALNRGLEFSLVDSIFFPSQHLEKNSIRPCVTVAITN